jgi:murein DD-endopeptidase MepM/ murein hydrolase activator NlpD
VDTLVVHGAIERDLWTAFSNNSEISAITGELVLYIPRMFQSQIDFSRQIQPGDTYRIVIERELRHGDESMRDMTILAAEIMNRGRPVAAIWFDLNGDGVGGYYDVNGESLRLAFLQAPLEYRRISSSFSTGRFHPILNVTRAHNGIVYAAASGTEVQATGEGTVTVRGVSGGFGNLVEIRHADGYVTRYAHLSRFASGVRVGSRVAQSQVIGYVGMSGLATGPHLHYELHKDGRPMDPRNLDLPQGEPIPADDRARWDADFRVRYGLLQGARMDVNTRMAEAPAKDAPASPRAN